MSSTETHSGRIKIITKTTEDTINFINEHLSEYWKADLKNNRLYIDETDAFIEEYWKQGKEFKYDTIEVKGQYWLIEYINHKKYSEDEEIAEIGKNPDGTYDFLCQFYNGGTCLEEVLEYLIEDDGIE